MIQIRCRNNGATREFTPGTTLQEIYDALDLNMPYGAVSARVNNKVESLGFKVYNHKDVEFLDITSDSGMRTYVRSLFFVLTKAVSELYPEGEIIIEHPVSKGYYCNLRIGRPVEEADVEAIKQRMQEIIAADIPIYRVHCPTEEAVETFRREGRSDVVTLLEVLEHIPDVQSAVTNAVRLARRFVVVSVPSQPDDNPEHIHLLTKDILTRLFAEAGCTKLHFSGVNGHLIMMATIEKE